MSQPFVKRIRAEESNESLSIVLEQFKREHSDYLFFTVDQYLKWLGSKPINNICSLFTSGALHGLKLSSFTVPQEFQSFDYTRDKNYKITEITDGTTTLTGMEVASIAVTEQVTQAGFNTAYINSEAPEWIIGHKDVMLEEFEYAKSKDEKPTPAYRIFSYGVQTACYADPAEILRLISVEGVKVEDYRNIAMAASNVAKEGIPLGELELDSPASLSAQLKKTDAANAVQGLAQVLFASHLKSMGEEDKIIAFEQNPSARLASLLGFKMPTRLEIVHTSNKAVVESVAIEKLGDDDEIILSNVNLTAEFYSTVSSASQVKVVKFVKSLSVKNRNQKVQPLKRAETMVKKRFLRILTAIEQDNQATGTLNRSDTVDSKVSASGLQAFFKS